MYFDSKLEVTLPRKQLITFPDTLHRYVKKTVSILEHANK